MTKKVPSKSIVGGAIARELLFELNKEKHFGSVFREYNGGVFSLRKCWKWHYTGFNHELKCYDKEKIATGSLVLDYTLKFDWLPHTFTREYKLTKSNLDRAEHFLCIAITRIYRQAYDEKRRMDTIKRLIDFCKPLEDKNITGLIRFVESNEKEIGTSVYSEMSEDVALDWLVRIKQEFGIQN